MSTIDGMLSGIDEEQERQPLDIVKELFTDDNLYTKSSVSEREIMIISRALWFGERYQIPEIERMVKKILLLKRSKGAMVIKMFGNTLKSMKPTFETKETDGGGLKI